MGILERRPRVGGAIRAALGIADHRELIIRSSGRVFYVPLPGFAQLMLFAVAAGVGGWVAHTSSVYFRHYELISGSEAQLTASEERNEALLSRMFAMRDRFSAVTGRLEQKHRALADVVESNATLKRALQELHSELRHSEAKRAEQTKRQVVLNRQLVAMKDRLATFRDARRELLVGISRQTAADIDRIERVVDATGLELAELVGEPGGRGGPFVPLMELEEGTDGESLVEAFNRQMARWESLRKLVRALPLVAPMPHYRVTSRFGEREDPINGNAARHEGLDLAGPMRSPIYATAAGRVVYSGWRGGYGRSIEIDHGNGIRTRYGHLRKIHVKRGQKVASGQKIGQLGSSGRSTGPHVHYEILVHGKPVDPEKFLKAGRDVFKG